MANNTNGIHGFSAVEKAWIFCTESSAKQQRIYDAHKDEIKRLSIRPFHELIAEMTPEMVKIDPQFVTVPSRMVSRVRRDTRYTKDKTLYRANMWLFFRRARRERESVPAYYFELHPEYWAFGCWGAWGRGEMEALREMILAEDRLFLDAFRAVNSCPQVHLAGEIKAARNSDKAGISGLAEPQGDRRGLHKR